MADPNPVGGGAIPQVLDGGLDREFVAVGRVGKAHGVRGDVFVHPWSDQPFERFVPGAVLSTRPAENGPLTVESARNHSDKLVVHFAGVHDRAGVGTIRGTVLVIPAATRPVIDDEDEFYDTDLIGLIARTVSGDVLGPVQDVLHSAGDSLLVINRDGQEVLIPFRKEFVPTVDLGGKVLEVDPPIGLLEL